MKASVQKTISTENACGGLLVTFFFFFLNEIVTLTLVQHGTLVLFPLLLCSKLYGCKYSFLSFTCVVITLVWGNPDCQVRQSHGFQGLEGKRSGKCRKGKGRRLRKSEQGWFMFVWGGFFFYI